VLTRSAARQDATYVNNVNILLDELFGAAVHDLPAEADAQAFAEARATELRGQGRNVYVAPLGGSSPLGCLGYAACAYEIAAQEQALQLNFGRLVLANGSGGTQAGLAAGFTLLEGSAQRVQAYTVLAPLAQAQATTEQKAAQTLALLQEQPAAAAPQILVRGNQLGEGYGVPTPAMLAAVRVLAQTEGLLLDPVYSGKAFAGLLNDARTGQFRPGEQVLFLMTGGLPGLFAYRTAF
jgi:L-cysteate sulfo-lyase